MSINGINGGFGNAAPTPSVRDRAPIDESGGKAISERGHHAGEVKDTRQTTRGVPAEAPPGTDPALWSVLTSAERSFFASAQPAGPLTYGRTNHGKVSPGLGLGGRFDVRV